MDRRAFNTALPSAAATSVIGFRHGYGWRAYGVLSRRRGSIDAVGC